MPDDADSLLSSDEPQPAGDTPPSTPSIGAGLVAPDRSSELTSGEDASSKPALPEGDSQLVEALDTHSEPIPYPASQQPAPPMPGQVAAEATEEQKPAPPQATTPVDVAKQATQQVTTAVQQSAHQVTAAVQQGAQKITVAPRKALYRGRRFMLFYGGMVGAAGALALLARRHRYFVGDIGIARLIQHPKSRLYDSLMHAASQLGWQWTSVATRASTAALFWVAGFRMESAFTVSTWTGDLMTIAIKTRVLRPRPAGELVRVVSLLKETSFPSGHVVHYVTFYGFLFYLVFTHLKQRWFRTALLTLLAGIIFLVGPSRVYMGHHWPSDVGGAYLVGTLWLGFIIIAYIETKANYTLHTRPPFFVRRPKQLG
jgi:membrane-associated phospholipid phosphatase